MITNSIAKRLETDGDWIAVHSYIKEQVNSLNSLDGIDFSDKESAAIKAEGRQEAIKILEMILEPFFSKDESTTDAGERKAKQTGVV